MTQLVDSHTKKDPRTIPFPHPSQNGAPTDGSIHEKDQALLNELTKLWQGHHRRGLELRHTTGVRLNDHFGAPAKRQAYGKSTIARYATSLGVSESDLSRMRRFAHEFKSVEEFSKKHPQDKIWTDVKLRLAQLKPNSVPAKVTANHEKAAARRRVRQAIETADRFRRHVQQVGNLQRDSDDWKALSGSVEMMLKALEASLGLRFQAMSVAMPGEVSPPAVLQDSRGAQAQ